MSLLKAGAGCAAIEFPQEMFPFEGFKGVHDAPHVRVLYMEQGSRFVLAAYEIVMLHDPMIRQCREMIAQILGVDIENVWIHMTHAITTPHGPMGPKIGLGGHAVEKSPEEQAAEEKLKGMYDKAILTATEEAAGQALAGIREAYLGIGTGESRVNCCRDFESELGWWIGINPDGPSNRKMTVLKFTDAEKKPLAFLISYGIKPCAIDNSQMSENERLVSSDVPGLMCTLLEEKYGAPSLFVMAAAGDQIPRKMAMYDVIENGEIKHIDLGVAEGLRYVDGLGHEMAADAVAIIEGIETVSEGNAIRRNKGSYIWETKGRMEFAPRREYTYETDGKTAEMPVETFRLGDVAFVACKPETNCRTEMELQEASPVAHTLLMSMINGGMKYMPDQESYDKVKWESQSSMLMPGAAEKFVETAAKLLAE